MNKISYRIVDSNILIELAWELLALPNPHHSYCIDSTSTGITLWLLNNNGIRYNGFNIDWNKLNTDQLFNNLSTQGLSHSKSASGGKFFSLVRSYCETKNETEFLKKILYFTSQMLHASRGCNIGYQMTQTRFPLSIPEICFWQIERSNAKYRIRRLLVQTQ